MARKFRYFVGDFETTVYKGQVCTEVWASACVEFGSENVEIFHSIKEQFDYLKKIKGNVCIYYHNLKFDGAFWLSFLMTETNLKQAFTQTDKSNVNTIEFDNLKDMPNNSFTYVISSLGQWYKITIKTAGKIIEIRDSLKLLPFTVERIGKSFATKHKKLNMEYDGFRYAGCDITNDERNYIANDVLVVKEALEIMFNEGHKNLTIGSCCLTEYKKLFGKEMYDFYFPDLTSGELNKFECKNIDEYIRKSYHGGWCYVVKGKENKVFTNGTTADVNSLYPSMMSSESGNRYPYGEPTFWQGDYIPTEALKCDKYYFIRIKTRFYLKQNMLPFIQIKNTMLYPAREMLETSDIYDYDKQEYQPFYFEDNQLKPAIVTLTLTMTDFELLKEHYDLIDFEILDGCYFDSVVGLFDDYIEKYKKIKLESKGAKRELAKLFLNNLYGKMASSDNSSFKVAYVKEDKSIGFYTVVQNEKKAGYIPIGSAITSYAREFTIRTAQKNFYGVDKRGFIYADTDSIHCDLKAHELKGVKVHDKNFCCWKLESYWDKGFFVRPKTYIEHVTHDDGEPVENYYNVKCAGMPKKCKDLLIKSFEGYIPKDSDDFTDDELKFIECKREMTDFKVGLTVPSKLMPKTIRGGVLLTPTTFKLR